MTRIGELFAGYGGLGMAVQQVYGGELAWYSEFDDAPSRIMAHHHPGVPNYGDVTQIDWDEVPRVDILTGGFPCQDVSVAGRRAGMTEGTRSGLWSYMRTAIDRLRPELVVIENVGGLFSAQANRFVEPCPYGMGDAGGGGHTVFLRAADAVLGDLASIGYDAEWVAVRASDVGAPHGRLRVFITAHPAPVPDSAGGRWRAAVPVARTQGRADASALGADPRSGPPGTTAGVMMLPTPTVNDMGAAYTPEQWDEWTDRMRAEHGNGNGHGKSLSIEAQRLLPTPRATDGTEGAERFGSYAPAIQRWEQLMGRPAPAPTEPGKNRPRLAATFVEWMMGLPDGHVTAVPGLTRNHQLKALGNGVVPQQGAAALAHLHHVREAA